MPRTPGAAPRTASIQCHCTTAFACTRLVITHHRNPERPFYCSGCTGCCRNRGRRTHCCRNRCLKARSVDAPPLQVLFIGAIGEWGPLGYLAFAAVYTGLELLSVPTVPLAMAAGAAFGPGPGTAVTALSGVAAATAGGLGRWR